MLLNCPECQLPISDKAAACPHCGFPMRQEEKQRPPRKSSKKKRLPNGFGQISEIKNRNLRKPFRAMVTVGKASGGRPICKPLKPEAYFETYNDAYAALVEYNQNPCSLDPAITMQELYEKWSVEYFEKKSDTYARVLRLAWRYCSQVYAMRVIDLRARHIKACIEKGSVISGQKEVFASPNTKNTIKTLFNNMLDYAVEYEIVDHNYARTFQLDESTRQDIKETKVGHIPFSEQEMEALWAHAGVYAVDMLLIQCYSGWRPKELLSLKLCDVDVESWTFRGGCKTENGKNRTVPIHSRIRDLVLQKYKDAQMRHSDLLFNNESHGNTVPFSYVGYSRCFHQICMELGLNPAHRPHDGRVHFVTMAKKCNVDEYAIKYMVGHSITDITEKVYTKRDIAWLSSEIKKIV